MQRMLLYTLHLMLSRTPGSLLQQSAYQVYRGIPVQLVHQVIRGFLARQAIQDSQEQELQDTQALAAQPGTQATLDSQVPPAIQASVVQQVIQASLAPQAILVSVV